MCEENNTGEATIVSCRKTFLTPPVDGQYVKATINFAKRKVVKVDKCIVPLIEELNENGFPTMFSCCGHNNTERPYVLLYIRKDKEDEDKKKAMEIVRNHWNYKNYKIEDMFLWWNDFNGYRAIHITPKVRRRK